jgi:hypothetical protein
LSLFDLLGGMGSIPGLAPPRGKHWTVWAAWLLWACFWLMLLAIIVAALLGV